MKKNKSLLTQTVLASTLFCLSYQAQAFLDILISGDSGTYTPLTGYNIVANNVTLTILASTPTIGTTGGISVDNNNGNFFLFCGGGACNNTILNFNGATAVGGSIGTTNPIDTINVSGSSTANDIVLFKDDVHVGVGNLNFTGPGPANTTMEFANNADIFGNVNNLVGSANRGILLFDGTSSVSGTVGASNALNAVNVRGGAGTTVTFNDDITAANMNFITGATATTNLDIADNNITITGNIDNTTGTANIGIVKFEGDSEVTGTIGATKSLNEIDIRGLGKTVIFDKNVTANTILFTGNADATTAAEFKDTVIVTGNIDAGTNDIGNILFDGGGTVTGNIGATKTIHLLEIDADNFASKTVELKGAIINATSILVNDDNSSVAAQGTTLKLNNANMVLTAPITVNTTNEDTLDIFNAATLNGDIGAGGAVFNLIKVGQNSNTTINGNIFATTTQFNGSKTLSLTSGKTINGNVTSITPGTGTLAFLGIGAVTGTINNLAAVNLQGGVGEAVTFQDTVQATNVNLQTPAVIANFQKSVTGNVNFTNTASAASLVSFSDNANLTGNIDNTTVSTDIGTVVFHGSSTVSGTIGATRSIHEIDIDGAGETVNFQGNIHVGSGNLNFDGGADPLTTASINNKVSILGNVDNTTGANGNGILSFLGNGSMLGTIGATNSLAEVDINLANSIVLFAGDILNQTPIMFLADAIANIGSGVTVSGDIDTNVAGTGTVQFLGDATVNGVMGPTNGLKSLNILGDASTVTFNNNILNGTPIYFFANGTASIKSGETIFDVDSKAGTPTGTLVLQGSATVDDIGATSPLNFVLLNTLGGANTINFLGHTIRANTINVVGAGGTTLNFNSATGTDESGNITTNNNGIDIITINSLGNSIIDGSIGSPTNQFLELDMLAANSTLTVNGNIYANKIQLNAANTTLQLEDGASAFGPITANAPNQGIVTFLGNSTIGFPIGTGNAVNAVNINGPVGSVVNLNAAVNTNNFTVNNGGTLLPSNAGTITSVAPVTINNGILRINPNTNFNITGGLNISNANATLQIDMGNSLTNTGKVTTSGAAVVIAPGNLTILNPGFSPGKSTLIPIVIGGAGSNYVPAVNITNSNSFITQFSTQVTGNTLNLVVTSQALADVADQSNTTGVGGALDAIAASGAPVLGELGQILGQLNNFPDAASLNFALSTLAPTVDGALLEESFDSLREVYDSIDERFDRNHFWRKKHPKGKQSGLSSGDKPDQNTRWVKVIHHHANQDRRDGIEGYKNDMWGLVAGGDTYIQDNMMLGVALSWTNLDIRDKLIPYFNRTTANSFQATVYGSLDCNSPYFFDGVVSVAYNDYATQREILFANVNLFPRGEFHAWQTGAKAETGYVFDYGDYHAIPVATLLYSHLEVSSYTEQGAGNASQNIASSAFGMLLAGVGIKGTYDYEYDAKRIFQIQAHAMAYFDFINDRMELTSQFVGAGPSFVTSGFRPAKESFNLGGNLTLFNQKNWTFTASYDFDFKQDYTANAAFMRARYEW